MGEIYLKSSSMSLLFVCLSTLLLLPNGSFAGSNKQPGLDFQPKLPSYDTLIWYNSSSYRKYTDQLDDFMKAYTNVDRFTNTIVNCDNANPPPKGKLCFVDVNNFERCRKENFYNFHRQSPCIFLKLENIPDWVPDFYTNASNLPETMPEFLKNTIRQTDTASRNTVWVSCDGVYPADIEFIGPIDYHPKPGFPGYFFPMESETQYLSPLVAVEFHRPQYGVIINVECKLWARNIYHDRENLKGLLQFELLID